MRIAVTTIIIIFAGIFADLFSQAESVNDTSANMYYHVPGTDVLIKPPKYFMALPVQNTLLHPPTSPSLQINEIDGSAYKLVVQKLTPQYIENQNAHFIKKETITTNQGKEATLFLVSFTVEAKDSARTPVNYERIMFFTGNYNKTIWINANYPLIAKDVIYDVLINSLKSVKFDD